ncbi:hypothetical protein ANN_18639 [Periplaneta americana]|uniref:Uncharacterized protein n=1 Tax=Periplaneta americana TaxID=6978 RepID=A0ABQ8SPB3_PERAM|nr:hypothetical protein ANN_18639 [Periplaneta americana]
MEDNKSERNHNRNQKTKVELDRAHNQKEVGAVERMALDWNPQGSRRRGRPKNTWKRTILEEIAREGKTWSEVKKLATNRVIDGCAFRVYGHWVKKGEGQNRAALFENTPKIELKHIYVWMNRGLQLSLIITLRPPVQTKHTVTTVPMDHGPLAQITSIPVINLLIASDLN